MGIHQVSVKGLAGNKMASTYSCNLSTGRIIQINVTCLPIVRRFLPNKARLTQRLQDARTRSSYVPDYRIRVLEADQLMYFSILHIALGHYYVLPPRHRLYIDVDRLARRCTIDWERIMEWASEDCMVIRLLVVLNICKKLLNTPLPDRKSVV